MQIYQNTNFATLFGRFIAPSVISAVFFSIYTIIDDISVGSYLGNESLAAMGLVMPFIFIAFALADMIAIGSSVQISLHLGKNALKEAREIFCACVLAIVGISCIVGFLVYFGLSFLLDFMDASENIKTLSAEYSRVIAIFMPFIALSYALDNYLRICEKGVYVMWVGIFVVICNVALVCLFVIWLEMGIFGAGLAISLGLSFGTILSVLPFFYARFSAKILRPKTNAQKIFRHFIQRKLRVFGQYFRLTTCDFC
ncbi:MATE family efflux transporter [Helicobacter sp. 23-1044]